MNRHRALGSDGRRIRQMQFEPDFILNMVAVLFKGLHAQLATRLRTLLTGCVQSRERLLLGKRATSKLRPRCQLRMKPLHTFCGAVTTGNHKGNSYCAHTLLLCLTACLSVLVNAVLCCRLCLLGIGRCLQQTYGTHSGIFGGAACGAGQTWLNSRVGDTRVFSAYPCCDTRCLKGEVESSWRRLSRSAE